MKNMILAFALSATLAGAAAAQSAIPGQEVDLKRPPLSVLEVLNVGMALRQLGDYPEINPQSGQPTGKNVAVPYRFDGGTLMTMAFNISAAETVQKNYQTTYNKLQKQFAEGAPRVPPEKMPEFTAETEKAMAAYAGVQLGRIKESALCMASKPVPPCTTTNAIPPALLSAIILIVDRD